MSDKSVCNCSQVHARAICEEVGERLRVLLDRTQTPTPPRLLALLLRFQLQELTLDQNRSSRSMLQRSAVVHSR